MIFSFINTSFELFFGEISIIFGFRALAEETGLKTAPLWIKLPAAAETAAKKIRKKSIHRTARTRTKIIHIVYLPLKVSRLFVLLLNKI